MFQLFYVTSNNAKAEEFGTIDTAETLAAATAAARERVKDGRIPRNTEDGYAIRGVGIGLPGHDYVDLLIPIYGTAFELFGIGGMSAGPGSIEIEPTHFESTLLDSRRDAENFLEKLRLAIAIAFPESA